MDEQSIYESTLAYLVNMRENAVSQAKPTKKNIL
jgi:hypothetical protein